MPLRHIALMLMSADEGGRGWSRTHFELHTDELIVEDSDEDGY